MTTSAAEPDAPPRRPHLLIVDDLPANLGVLLGVLDGAGYEVRVATSGAGALARMDHVQPDLILLDVNMPGLDGYETCRRLKADPRWRGAPVIFLTAQDDPADTLRGFEAGAVDYITKPLHAGEVLARVRAHLQIRALQQALAEKNGLLETAMARRLEAEAQLQQSLDRAVLVVDTVGRIEFCTRLARRLLTRYLPGYAAHTLPPPLVAWLTAGPGTSAPWRTERPEGWLEVQLFASRQPGAACRMLLLEEHLRSANSPARLLSLGLTVREAEVLYWAAHGKSNQEVALILSTALNTVKKHVANLLVKMGTDTRLTAALQAAEILELKNVQPTKLRGPAEA